MKSSRRGIAVAVLALAWTAGCSASSQPAGSTQTAASVPAAAGGGGGGGVSAGAGVGAGAASSSAAGGTLWIIGGSTLMRWESSESLATLGPYFDTPRAYVVTGAKEWFIPAGWTSTPTASFTSYSSLQSALSGNLDPRIKAVLYDNEHWSLTPAAEQRDAVHYYQLAAQLAHQHHLVFIATPAIDLVSVLNPAAPSGNGQRYQAFLDLGLFGQIAASADVIEIQAQGAEGNVSLFTTFVGSAAAQARKANPAVKVLAGISTNPNGAAATADAIDRAARAVRANVDGYWLNDPTSSTACPMCTGPYPQVALASLSGL